ncbi:MAG: DEAD/DEAH box helicase [Candidatus Cloacimonetes bacterium]|nr:DEAD/DEAH box helicase [Candidatus Cloacimonadota bacterium]
MAKLFSKEYHEISNTWYFKQNVLNINKDSVNYTIYKLYDYLYRIVFRVFFNSFEKLYIINIDYDYDSKRIIKCTSQNERLENFYKYALIKYAYENLTTSIFDDYHYAIYDKNICRYNENEYQQYQSLHYQIEGFFNNAQSVIKIYVVGLDELNYIDFISFVEHGQEFLKEEFSYKNSFLKAFVFEELIFLRVLMQNKRSIGKKKLYISIYRDDFVNLVPFITPIANKFFIFETGDKLFINDTPLSMEFLISSIDENNYILKLVENQVIHQFMVKTSMYLLSGNVLSRVILPFTDDVIKHILNGQMIIDKHDLVYYKTIIAKQLTINNHHLDFEAGIELPEVNEETPDVYIIIKKTSRGVLFNCYLEYSDLTQLPIIFVREKINLISLNNMNTSKWYYISDDLISELDAFLTSYLFYREYDINEYSWEVTHPAYILVMKENLFEKANPKWIIQIDEELKKNFIQSIVLVPEIIVNKDEDIDWFSYKIIYKFNNISVTQDDLRNFFKVGENFLKLPDGSLVTIKNKEIFDEFEEIVKLSKKDADYFHRASIYRLPWIYELSKNNPAINIYGDEYLNEMYAALINRATKDKVEPYYTLKPVMRSYQKTGYEWLKMLEKYKLSGILADDMGLGKTLQAISVLTDLKTDSKSLIICPKTLLFNWAAEIEKFNPQLKYIIYEGKKEERINLLNNSAVQLVFCSYALIQNDLEIFKKIHFEYVILDEAQHIKNHNTLRSKAVKKLKARYKLAMTGTPLENSISELWSVFDFLMPGYLPSIKKFKDMFSADQDSIKQGQRVKQYISPFILRRKKQDVLFELPDKQEQYVYCPMTESQENKYIQILKAVKNDVFKDGDTETNFITMLAALTRLRQVCDHPGLINDEWMNEANISGKLDTLKELLEDALENGRKILVFSQYVKMLHIVEKMIKKMNINYEYMDGNTKDRKTVINHFNDNEKVKVFLISLKTGGFGINLTSADTVILVDPWWNPMVESQAIDRVHRMGQTKKVVVYKMITVGSVEEKIMILQKRKRDLFDNIINQGDSVLKNLEYNEIKSLFEYKE